MSFWFQNGVCSNNPYSHRQIRQTGKTRRRLGALVALCGMGAVAHAQDSIPAGMTATFDVTQRLEYSDNPDLDVDGTSDFYGRTILGFGLQSTTALQRFSFDIGTDIEQGRKDEPNFDVTNSTLRLRYDRATRNASLGTTVRYSEYDVTSSSSSFEDDFDIDGNVINQNSGTRKRYGLGLEGAVGIEAPIGASWSLDYDELTYSGTNDPDLTDTSSFSASGQLNFRIDPRITASLTGEYGDFDAEGNGVDRETTRLGTRFLLDITPTLRGDFGLSYDRIERSGDETGTDEGVSMNTELTRTLKNGTLGLSLDSDVSSNDDGRRGFISANRAMELPRGATLSYSLGGTRSENSGFDPLIDVGYAYALPTAQVRFGLSQRVSTNNDNEEQILTTLSMGYDREINSLSSIGTSLSFLNRNDLDAEDDGRRIDLSLSYRYALTSDWGLVSGFSYTKSTSDGENDRDRSTIFVGVQRNFTWNP